MSSMLFSDKVILAPMVRENSLPFRLLCLRYGADLVYSEELVDYRLSECRRLINKPLGTIDFVDSRGEVLFRTCPEEKGKVVLQLGSNNPERALKAAKLVSSDVLAVDFNFGCPKSFSLKGGMGAALLEKPQEIEALLKKCVENLNIPVTCKMRILPDLNKTLELVKMIESCGVAAIAVHGRTKEQRPIHENNNEVLRAIAESIRIPLIANGGSNYMRSYTDVIRFKTDTKASSVMVARAAMRNPSIFRSDNKLEPQNTVIVEFLKLAAKYHSYFANTKYTIQSLLSEGKKTESFHASCDFESLCDVFGLRKWYGENKVNVGKEGFYDHEPHEDTDLDKLLRAKKKDFELVCDNVPYMPKIFGLSTPKSRISSQINKLHHLKTKPEFNVIQTSPNRYYCMILFKNKCYVNKTFSNSKKGAEHASALLLCQDMKLIDLEDYRKRTIGITRSVC